MTLTCLPSAKPPSSWSHNNWKSWIQLEMPQLETLWENVLPCKVAFPPRIRSIQGLLPSTVVAYWQWIGAFSVSRPLNRKIKAAEHLRAWETSMNPSSCGISQIPFPGRHVRLCWQMDYFFNLVFACPTQDILVYVSSAASPRCWSLSAGCSNLVAGSTWADSSCPSNWPGPFPSTRARWASANVDLASSLCAWTHSLITDRESSAVIVIEVARLCCM